jgi:AraC family transcriptional regulator
MLRYFSYGQRQFLNPPFLRRFNWEFYAILKGKCAPALPKGEELPLEPRTLWVFRPRVAYGWKGEGTVTRAAFHYPSVPHELEHAMGEKQFLNVKLQPDEVTRISQLAESLKTHYENPCNYSHLAFEAALAELSLFLLKNFESAKRVPLNFLPADRVNRALNWYAVHIMENPTVEQVAAAVNMSAGHLRRTFQSVRNQSPHEALRECQIKRACDLLSTTPDTLDQISGQCGFQSVTHFIRVFNSLMGVSPNTWRRQEVISQTPARSKRKSSKRRSK